MAKKTVTTPSQFRLKPETLAMIDAIGVHMSGLTENAAEISRADAIRFAVKRTFDSLNLKTESPPGKRK